MLIKAREKVSGGAVFFRLFRGVPLGDVTSGTSGRLAGIPPLQWSAFLPVKAVCSVRSDMSESVLSLGLFGHGTDLGPV